LTLAVDKKSFYEENIPSTAFVLPNRTIQIYPGEVIYVEIDQENGIIKNMRAVPEIKDSSKTMILSFIQVTENKIPQQMILKITNLLSWNLTYDASMFLMNQKRWVKTEVYPVKAGLQGFETWPDIIVSLGLGNWKLEK
jgi:hypothetical protein